MDHLESFRPSNFANTDAFRAHAKSGLDQVTLSDLTCPFRVRRTGLDRYPVRDAVDGRQFVRVLDEHDSAFARDAAEQHVSEGDLTASETNVDDDIALCRDTC